MSSFLVYPHHPIMLKFASLSYETVAFSHEVFAGSAANRQIDLREAERKESDVCVAHR